MAAAWQVLARCDARLGAAIRQVGPCPLVGSGRPPYEALLSAIAHQQLHGVAARAILHRLCALEGRDRYPSPVELLATPEETLRGVGLSRAKLIAMRDVAQRALDGTVPDLATMQAMDDEAIIERLVAVRGVGRWTAQMLLISTLGRPDVMPADDFGVRLGYQWLYGLPAMPTPKALHVACEQFAPYRSTVALYLWRYVDLVRARTAAGDGGTPARTARAANVQAKASATRPAAKLTVRARARAAQPDANSSSVPKTGPRPKSRSKAPSDTGSASGQRRPTPEG